MTPNDADDATENGTNSPRTLADPNNPPHSPPNSTIDDESGDATGDAIDSTATDAVEDDGATSASLGEYKRRRFLQTVGAGALLGTIGVDSALADPESAEFVETDGTQFVVGGDPVYFSGTNNFWITDPYSDRSRIDDVLALMDDLGQNLLRTWAFCEGDGGHCLQPEPGVHDEAALQHLDYLVAAAGERGIRLVLIFVDNWDAYGGIPQYVEWASGASEHGDFYVNQECRDLYRNHVETIVTRENSITGVEYRNDPTIAIWELANEPRLEGDDTTTIDDRQATLGSWFDDMASYVKELDGNHLVSTGMEGFYTRADGPNWMYDDWTGQSFVDHHQLDAIDVCSFHLYPYHWPGLGLEGQLAEDDVASCVEWIAEHVADAHEQVGKPVHLGEFNVNAQENDLATRNDRLQAWYDELDAGDADAATIWQLVLESTEDHDGFQVYRSESGDILADYADRAKAKSGSGDGSPLADARAPTSLRRGESGEFSGAFSFHPDGTIASYDWAFGDGATATGEQVSHRFGSTGEQTASLTVTDDAGATDTDEETVTVEKLPAGSVLLEGAGETVHESTKEFHFAYVDVSGDFTRDARLTDLEPTDLDAQAGVMIVDDPSSPGALGAATITPGSGSELTRAYDSTVWRERAGDDRTAPIDLRIERSGNSVTAYAAADGESWTEIGSGDVDLPDSVAVGLFVSSNSPGDLATAQFESADWLEGFTALDVGDVEVAGATTAASDGDGGDAVAPTTPANLTVTETTSSSLTVEWDASTDEGGSGLDHYEVFVDGSQEQTVPAGTASATVEELVADASYEVGVSAVDGAGNASPTAAVTATTDPSDDETAPSAPTNLSVADATSSSIDLEWDASTDDGGSGLDHYAVSVDGSQDHTVPAGTTSTTVDELAAGTSYEIGVSAVDGAGNESGTATVSASTDEDGDDPPEEPPADALVVNDYDGDPAWPGGNDLGNWNGAGSFQNGDGSGEVVDGALELEYQNAGWFVEQIQQDVSEYSSLVFEVAGASGGEGSHFTVSLGGTRGTFAVLADGSVGTSPSTVSIDLADAGVDQSSSGELRLNFWEGGSGSSTLVIEEIRFE